MTDEADHLRYIDYFESPYQVERGYEGVKKVDHKGHTWIHRAAFHHTFDDLDRVLGGMKLDKDSKKMIELVNMRDKAGLTPIFITCMGEKKGRSATLRTLIKHGAKLEATQTDENGWTMAHWLSLFNDVESMKILEDNYIELFLPDKKGFFCIDIAGKSGNGEAAKYLKEVYQTIRENKLNKVKYMPEEGRTNYFKAMSQEEAVYYIYNSKYLNLIILYWCIVFNIEINDISLTELSLCAHLPTLDNATLYHAASQNKEFSVMWFNKLYTMVGNAVGKYEDKSLLLEMPQQFVKGFHMNWISACNKKYILRMTELKKKKNSSTLCEFDTVDNNGNTPLHVASERHFDAAVAWLLNKGANFYTTNKKGFAPSHLVKEERTIKVYIDFYADLQLRKFSDYQRTDWVKRVSAQTDSKESKCCKRKVYVESDPYKKDKEKLLDQLQYNCEDTSFFNLVLKVRIRGGLDSMEMCDYLIDVLKNRGYEICFLSDKSNIWICVKSSLKMISELRADYGIPQDWICTREEVNMMLNSSLNETMNLKEMKQIGYIDDFAWLFNYAEIKMRGGLVDGEERFNLMIFYFYLIVFLGVLSVLYTLCEYAEVSYLFTVRNLFTLGIFTITILSSFTFVYYFDERERRMLLRMQLKTRNQKKSLNHSTSSLKRLVNPISVSEKEEKYRLAKYILGMVLCLAANVGLWFVYNSIVYISWVERGWEESIVRGSVGGFSVWILKSIYDIIVDQDDTLASVMKTVNGILNMYVYNILFILIKRKFYDETAENTVYESRYYLYGFMIVVSGVRGVLNILTVLFNLYSIRSQMRQKSNRYNFSHISGTSLPIVEYMLMDLNRQPKDVQSSLRWVCMNTAYSFTMYYVTSTSIYFLALSICIDFYVFYYNKLYLARPNFEEDHHLSTFYLLFTFSLMVGMFHISMFNDMFDQVYYYLYYILLFGTACLAVFILHVTDITHDKIRVMIMGKQIEIRGGGAVRGENSELEEEMLQEEEKKERERNREEEEKR